MPSLGCSFAPLGLNGRLNVSSYREALQLAQIIPRGPRTWSSHRGGVLPIRKGVWNLPPRMGSARASSHRWGAADAQAQRQAGVVCVSAVGYWRKGVDIVCSGGSILSSETWPTYPQAAPATPRWFDHPVAHR